MHTSLIMVALLGPGELAETPTARTLKWQDSYSTARQMGRQERKPLAVFIGNGPTGWKKVVDEGNLSEKATRVLTEGYICLYVDRTRDGGESLATIAGDAGIGVNTLKRRLEAHGTVMRRRGRPPNAG